MPETVSLSKVRFSEDEIWDILEEKYINGARIVDIAKWNGIAYSTVSNIVRGQRNGEVYEKFRDYYPRLGLPPRNDTHRRLNSMEVKEIATAVVNEIERRFPQETPDE